MNLTIHYEVRYIYEEVVGFSPHTIRLFPRQDHYLRIDDWKLNVSAGADIQLRRDAFDNPVAFCFIPRRHTTLEIALELHLKVQEKNPFHFLIDSSAEQLPFELTPDRHSLLLPYLESGDFGITAALDFLRLPTASYPAHTIDTLVGLNTQISEMIRYERREEGEARTPDETLKLRSGACRDTSWLMAALLRRMGVPARLVSGYLCEFDVAHKERRAEGALHAWTEAYLPGAGWIAMDPTNGVLCNHNFIAAAVGRHPGDVTPVSGSYYADHAVPARMEAELSMEHTT